MNEISNNVAKQAAKDACDAYKKFFKGLASFPKLKSKNKSRPSFYNYTSQLKVKEKSVLIEKIGWIKTNKPIPINVKYINLRISYDNKYLYLSIEVEREQLASQLTDEILSIDVGIKNLDICSNDMVVKNINKTITVKKLENKLRRLQRTLSQEYERNKKGKEYVKTSNIIKPEKQIILIHRRLTHIRANHLHQTTNRIVKTKIKGCYGDTEYKRHNEKQAFIKSDTKTMFI